MSLEDNLTAAKAAVDYVKSLNIRAMNRLSDRLAAEGGIDKVIGSDQGLRAVFAEFDQGASMEDAFAKAGAAGVGVSDLRGQTMRPTSLMRLRFNAQLIVAQKFGNCEEQAQVAMLHIYDNYKAARPLDLLCFNAGGYDHVWVGVGLSPTWNKAVPDGRNGVPGVKRTKYSLREWGPEAVWCDPWQSGGVAFAVQDLVKGSVRNLSAEYKCDSAERVEDGAPMSMLRIN